MRIKRVLMTGDTVGGVWAFTMDLARELCAQGIQVCLAAFGGIASFEQRQQALAIEGLRLLTFDLKLEWMENPWADIQQATHILSRLERDFTPDVVHLNSYGYGKCPWQAPVILTAHSCVASWWNAVKHAELPATWNRYRSNVELAIGTAAMVTAPSAAMLDSLSRHYSIIPRRSQVIANGRRLHQESRQAKLPIIFNAGRLWDEGKNVAALARVAHRLPWPIYLAGSVRSPQGRTISFDECRMLGPLSPATVTNWLQRASIYAAPAQYEPFGLSTLEAAAAGCALVLGDIPSQREIWNDAALFVMNSELEQALRRLIAHPDLLREYGLKAQARARDFTAEKMATAYLNAYEVALDRRHACAS